MSRLARRVDIAGLYRNVADWLRACVAFGTRRSRPRSAADTTKNFCWGGSTAIRRSTFERLQVAEHWRGTVSDDFTITRVLKEAKLPIHFTPNCLVPSVGDCDLRRAAGVHDATDEDHARLCAASLVAAVARIGVVLRSVFRWDCCCWFVAGSLPVFSLLPCYLCFVLGAAKVSSVGEQ